MAGSDGQLALQKALVAALKNNTDAGANVFDDVPTSNPYPRITFGPIQVLPNLADCMDGSEAFVQIDVWSQSKIGMVETKTIAGQIRSILQDATLTLDGHELQMMQIDNAQYLRDPDGLTKHAAITFRALTQPL